jgi:TonB family protein
MLRFIGCVKLIRLAILVSIFLPLASPGNAQLANIDKLGEEFAKQLKSFKPKMVAVADLAASGEDLRAQGHEFSAFLSSSIQHHGKKLPILDHPNFDADLKHDNVSLDAFVSGDATSALHGKIPEDILVIGAIVRNAQVYSLTFSAIRVSSGETLFSKGTTFARTEFIDSLTEPFPPQFDHPIFLGGHGGIGAPTCISCPDPQYNDYARRDRIQGTSVFNVLVSPEGRAVRLQPVRLIGEGLDEEAFKIIKTWRFKPAINKEGTPVYVIIPIEVTFRLF